ncbi:MazG-like family protein [Labrys sp. (in: a-proteobacteria)]|uniref:MazG-like family protein n=1 Tax=Labrys sp. (in: a-proteobacteria) TaxID=1917972 RepID=UPI0039E2573C
MPNALTLGALRAANIARNVEWDIGGEKLSATFRTTELAGEVGEICNVVKKLERERIGVRGSRDTIEHLAEEIADGIITLDLVAMHYGIDAERAVIGKFNRTSEANGLQTRLSSWPVAGQWQNFIKPVIDQLRLSAATGLTATYSPDNTLALIALLQAMAAQIDDPKIETMTVEQLLAGAFPPGFLSSSGSGPT